MGIGEVMKRDSVFSYRCMACGRCCVNKQIAVNPYEVLRLARSKGVSTGEFISCFLAKDGPYLRVTTDGDCVFYSSKKCSVHADRPLPCRTYPLGRWVSADGEETFRELQPHPQCKGVYGEEGTVMDFLKQQEAQPYLENADRYQGLFYRLFDALQEELSLHSELA
ncbi:MAG: YkgJ family cysteine cluster protein, partial [Thermodesulfobacteriota bacterium]